MTRLLLLAALLIATPAAADPLRLVGAGSLTAAMTAMIEASGIDAAPPVFGPSGLMRERIEGGMPADVFASADMGHPRRLASERPGHPVLLFARNALCATGRESLGLSPETVLDRMLDPAVKLGTSTPGADPGGDYAWAVFARADRIRPGARAALEAKALTLVGGPGSRALVPGKGPVEGVFLSGAADMMLGYCSGAAAIRAAVPGLATTALPPDLAIGPAYGMVVLSDRPEALRFALFVMSTGGQAVLARFGFQPVALGSE